MERFPYNPYYSPEKCGLKLVGSLEDPNADYSFSTVVLFKKNEDDSFWIVADSGCSCPSPFEDITSLSDMQRVHTWEEAEKFIASWGTRYDQADVHALKNEAREMGLS
jgi:hypothetical protein